MIDLYRWVAWREHVILEKNRAPGIVVLWHILVEMQLFSVECHEQIPQSTQLMRFTGHKPPGMPCTDCLQIVNGPS